jgi:carboxymethylenebutenolidase
MKQLNADQQYFVEEFYEDYREGLLTRRQFIKRLAFITGSMAATIATMGLVGCTAEELPEATEPMPMPQPPTAEPTIGATAAPELIPVPGAQSPFSVPEGDPDLVTADVTFISEGDDVTAYLARPAAEGIYPAVLVCHENRGLNDHIRDVARRFAQEGYVALAVDLLSREGGAANQDVDQVPGLLSGAPAGRHTADFIAGFHYLEAQDFVDNGRISMTGYCFGGGTTWDVAVALPELKAAVPFYGRGPDLAQVGGIGAAVLGVYAEQDSRINAGMEALDQALTEAGVTHQMNVYPGVNHAFHNDTGGRYVEEQATQAWLDTLAWFNEHV